MDNYQEIIKRAMTRIRYRQDFTGKYVSKLAKEYKTIFRHLKYKKIRLLELGVERGGSMLFWSDFFKHADTRIVGLDIKLPEGLIFPKRVTVATVDQNDAISMTAIAEKHGPFDIIIDDASHCKKETENSFNTLFKYVIPGGYYIIEDWSVGYLGNEFAGMTELVTGIIESVPQLEIDSFRVIYNNSTLAVFKGSTAIFRKKPD